MPSSTSSVTANAFSNQSSLDRDATGHLHGTGTPHFGFHTAPESPLLSSSQPGIMSSSALLSSSPYVAARIEFNRDEAKRDGFSFAGIRP
jgi:hypothetical protein